MFHRMFSRETDCDMLAVFTISKIIFALKEEVCRWPPGGAHSN